MSATEKQKNFYRVLVIEDDEGWLQQTKIRLEKRGYFVGLAKTKDQAIEQLDRCLYHAAIVDLKLDDKDPDDREGLRVLEYISRLNEGTRALVRSGFTNDISVINEMIKYGIQGLTEKDMNFVKEEVNKGATEISGERLFKTLEEAANEAQREIQSASARTVWQNSPFSFINGMLARDIQMKMGGGRMAELRSFLGELVEACAPWLQVKDNKILTPIMISVGDQEIQIVGYQTICWSRSLGKAVVIRFGQKACYDRGLEAISFQTPVKVGKVQQKLWDHKSNHYFGEVYEMNEINFQENFRKPKQNRAPEH